MALHRLTSITIGVPDVGAVRAFYRDFGLEEREPGRLASAAGGEQLRLVPAPRRNLLELGIGVDDPDDLGRIAANLKRLEVATEREARALRATEPVTGIRVVVEIAERIAQPPELALPTNGPGRCARTDARSPAVTDSTPARPRKLGHVVAGSRDAALSRRFFVVRGGPRGHPRGTPTSGSASGIVRSSLRRRPASRPSASQRFSKLNGHVRSALAT